MAEKESAEDFQVGGGDHECNKARSASVFKGSNMRRNLSEQRRRYLSRALSHTEIELYRERDREERDALLRPTDPADYLPCQRLGLEEVPV